MAKLKSTKCKTPEELAAERKTKPDQLADDDLVGVAGGVIICSDGENDDGEDTHHEHPHY